MRRVAGLLGVTALVASLAATTATTATAIPVDLGDATARTIVVEVVNNSGVESSGIYAGDPAATFGPLGDATYSVAAGVGTITISPLVWEAFLISGFGESLSPTEVGVVPETTTANVMTIDIASGLPGPDYSWGADVRADIPALGGIFQLPLFGRYTNTAYLGDRFPGAPPNTDWWYQPDGTGALVNSCREYRTAPVPAVGQCNIADFRGDEAYNPNDGTFTFLGVDSNQFVLLGFTNPNYALLRYRISEVPEPGLFALHATAIGTIALVARRRRRRAN
ncbi:MAG TPA: hypothetical protein EYQ60_13905 [Myxococcales bacterium]|nr:hypothetical protein [Myxococcales bacterium]